MIINANEILKNASKEKRAIPQFNINNLEWAKYILEAANQLNYPVILGFSEGTINYIGGYNTAVNIIKGLVKDLNIKIEVVIHLDHGSNFLSCKKAIDSGFTSVMIDASKQDLENNIKETKRVVDYAHKFNVSVEAEIGQVLTKQETLNRGLLADLSSCQLFVSATNIDSLAPAIGSVHGLSTTTANLDLILLKQLSSNIMIPLVLHGGSGILESEIKKAINLGVTKININTELQVVWAKKVREYLANNLNVYDPRKIIGSGEEAIKEIIYKNIQIFKNK